MTNLKTTNYKVALSKQRGMALVIAMIILPLLLVLGTMLMSNAFLGLKVTDSRVMKNESNMILNGAADDILNQTGVASTLAEAVDSTTFTSTQFPTATTSVELQEEVSCRRRVQASGTNFSCKYLQINFNHAYGRAKDDGTTWAQNSLGVGVEQPIIAN